MPTITINGVKHTPGSNTLKKMKKKAAAEAATKTSKPKAKKAAASEKPPTPATRKKKPVPGLRVPKGPMSPGGRKGHVAGYTKGGNAGEKKSTVFGVGPKAKLSTDNPGENNYYYKKRK